MKSPRLAACVLALFMAPAAQAAEADSRPEPAAVLAALRPAAPSAAELKEATATLERLRGNPDPAAHARAATLVDSLAARAPEYPRVLALQAWLTMNGHRFAEALALADQALALSPREPVALALRADALTELGRYEEAIAAVDTLGEGGASIPVLVRAAHLRRLHGDLPGALEFAREALLRSPPGHPDHVWLTRELAALDLQDGQPEQALALLQGLPAGDPETLILRARILESTGREIEACALWSQAAENLPLPAALVGQWRTSTDPAERRRLAHRLDGMARLDEAQGGLARRDFIDFFARDGRLPAAEELTRREYRRRPDVFSAGQLAWVLALAGKGEEATARAREAARLGTRDRDLEAWLVVVPAPGQALAAAPGAETGH
jgi:tetratricopeptide (TPR) repeat protein